MALNTRRQSKREELEAAGSAPQLTVWAHSCCAPSLQRNQQAPVTQELPEHHLRLLGTHHPCWAHTIPAVPHSKPGLCISRLAQAGARFLPKAPLLVLLIPKAGREVEQCPQDQPEEPQVLSVHTLGVIHGLSPGLPHPHWHSSSFRVCFKLSTSMACCFPTAAVFQLPAHSERSNQDSCEPPLLLAPAVPKPVGVPAAQMFISAPSSSLSLFCLVYKDLT